MAGAKTTMPARAGTTTNKNQLLRVCDTPAADAYIRNPGYRPTYSCMLTRPMSARLREQARTSTQPLSGIFTVTDTKERGAAMQLLFLLTLVSSYYCVRDISTEKW